VNLLNILLEIMQEDYAPPQVTPLADGGVQAEWHSAGHDLEIVVSADERPAYYYFNHESGKDEEAEMEAQYARVQDLIRRLS
jgi:hypothetical protein